MAKKTLKRATLVLIVLSLMLYTRIIMIEPETAHYKVVGQVNIKKPINQCVNILSNAIINAKSKDPLIQTIHKRNILLDSKYIIHACGNYYEDGKRYQYTNSKEALNNCIDKNIHFFEMDLKKSSDNKSVLVRHWESLYYNNKQVTKPLTYKQYLESKIYNKFTTLKISDVIDVLKKNRNMTMIVDVKEDYMSNLQQLAKEVEEEGVNDQIIVQFYHENEYDQVKSIVDSKGNQVFKYMIYTLYLTSEEERKVDRIKKFIADHPVVIVQVSNKFVDGKNDHGIRDKSEDEYLKSLLKMDVPIAVHSINRPSYKEKYENFGVKIFTTDTFF